MWIIHAMNDMMIILHTVMANLQLHPALNPFLDIFIVPRVKKNDEKKKRRSI